MKWCTWCNNFFEDIDDHITTCHEDEFKCPLCGKCCTNTGHFMEHLARHSSKQMYFKNCWYTFIYAIILLLLLQTTTV